VGGALVFLAAMRFGALVVLNAMVS